MNCPGCTAEMLALTLHGHSGALVTIDLCPSCHALWFDAQESLALSPASTLMVFARIGELSAGGARPKATLPPVLRCPRCRLALRLAHDRQRATRFEYWRCDERHGRFITFLNFLREKNFIRPLDGKALTELRRHVQVVNCSNCGGPIDLQWASGCPHCASPVSILDMKQAEALVTQLRDAATPKAVDPALPLNLLRARRETEAAFASIEQGEEWWRDVAASDLVGAGVSAIARLLGKKP